MCVTCNRQGYVEGVDWPPQEGGQPTLWKTKSRGKLTHHIYVKCQHGKIDFCKQGSPIISDLSKNVKKYNRLIGNIKKYIRLRNIKENIFRNSHKFSRNGRMIYLNIQVLLKLKLVVEVVTRYPRENMIQTVLSGMLKKKEKALSGFNNKLALFAKLQLNLLLLLF